MAGTKREVERGRDRKKRYEGLIRAAGRGVAVDCHGPTASLARRETVLEAKTRLLTHPYSLIIPYFTSQWRHSLRTSFLNLPYKIYDCTNTLIITSTRNCSAGAPTTWDHSNLPLLITCYSKSQFHRRTYPSLSSSSIYTLLQYHRGIKLTELVIIRMLPVVTN